MTIEEYLSKHDMSLTSLAEKARLHISLLSRWDSGESMPDGENLLQLVESTDGEITAVAVIRKVQRIRKRMAKKASKDAA